MRAVLIAATVAITCFAGLAIWQLGENDNDSGVHETLAPPPETADPLLELPRGWTKTANGAGGFALGVPPGWSAKAAGAKTTMKSPGSGVVVSVTADRTDEALDTELDAYATGIAERLAEGGAPVAAETPKTLGPGYEAAAVTVPAAAGSGGRGPRLRVMVVRRPELAAYPILVASNSAVKPGELDPIVSKLVVSLRGRPVTSGSS